MWVAQPCLRPDWKEPRAGLIAILCMEPRPCKRSSWKGRGGGLTAVSCMGAHPCLWPNWREPGRINGFIVHGEHAHVYGCHFKCISMTLHVGQPNGLHYGWGTKNLGWRADDDGRRTFRLWSSAHQVMGGPRPGQESCKMVIAYQTDYRSVDS